MILIKRTAFSSKGLVPYLKTLNHPTVYPLKYQIISDDSDAERLCRGSFFQGDLARRQLHTTSVNRDLEAGLRALGAGLAATGVIGSGIGIGTIFGSLANSVARNPSASKQIFANAIMGAAFCESLGLFALVIAFIIM